MIASAARTGLDHLAQDLASLVGVELTGLDAVDQAGKLVGTDRKFGDGQLLLLDGPEHVLLDPVAGQLELARGPGDGVVIVGDVLALLDQNVGVVGRKAVVGLEPLPPWRGQLADRRVDAIQPGFVDDHRNQIGLGKIAVIGGGLLLALGFGDFIDVVPTARRLGGVLDRLAVFTPFVLLALGLVDGGPFRRTGSCSGS